jgi:NAD(P)-dependent dehydrogenase (short-subunit alcohol dehydrogenase family)
LQHQEKSKVRRALARHRRDVMEGRLKNKRIVIAGGATGIGAETASRLTSEGAKVMVGDVNEAGVKATVQNLKSQGRTAEACVFDLADEASCTRLIEACVGQYGGIDGLLNVGANMKTAQVEVVEDLLQMSAALWESTFRVNLLGFGFTAKAAIPHMVKGGGGSIVHTSSIAAFDGQPRLPAYATSKVAIHALSRHIATRWGKDNIRSNVVAPGYVLTDNTLKSIKKPELDQLLSALPLTRMGKESDIAAAFAFLVSDDSPWITGQVLSVNGGQEFRD